MILLKPDLCLLVEYLPIQHSIGGKIVTNEEDISLLSLDIYYNPMDEASLSLSLQHVHKGRAGHFWLYSAALKTDVFGNVKQSNLPLLSL